jgi:phosphate transport system permease protein
MASDRFRAARGTLLVDRFMTGFIKIGGLGIIAAVLGIFLFIFIEVLPLFSGATISERATLPLPGGAIIAGGIDEWGELPFAVTADGAVTFIPADSNAVASTATLPNYRYTSVIYDGTRQQIVLGTDHGQLLLANVSYEADFSQGTRRVSGAVTTAEPIALATPDPIIALAFGDAGEEKLAAVIQEAEGARHVTAVLIEEQTQGLLAKGVPTVSATIDLSELVPGTPVRVLVDNRAESVIVVTSDGAVCYLYRNGENFEKRQFFHPFDDCKDHAVASIDYLLGDVSLVCTNPVGVNRIFSLHRDGGQIRIFGRTKEFPDLPQGATTYAPSGRNKSFVLTADETASLRFATTADVRWQRDLAYRPLHTALNAKFNTLALFGDDEALHVYRLHDPHPEASLSGLFGKVWYEGYDEPAYIWQSTGGSDDFEPKLSMIPLLLGTLKGTIYAMLFAIPIAILGAIYLAEFAHPRWRSLIKPAVELMASLPSVVLGFLAAAWLAPLIADRVPSLLAMIMLLPIAAYTVGWAWSRSPLSWRRRIPHGYEFLAFTPIMLLICYLGWSLGPQIEQWMFADPANGVLDFRGWWTATTGADYDTRNALVTGFMMGFAVIPLIFTITDDALRNVPKALRSGSLALGASRWQTAFRIVMPTASAGIFSALMIGFGRAIGETMIVVMATGNTPIMSLNMFNGMRTLSANIAVELPEAAKDGTLYRTLFLGAMLLFLMTFAINTIAEVLRQHLREKYKTV